MATYRKNATIVGIAKQSGKGTANTTPDVQLWLSGNSIVTPTMNKQDILETTNSPIPLDSFIASIEGAGDTQHFVMPVSIGFLLNAIIGRDTKTGSGDPWTHTIDWGATGTPTTLPYYTMLVSSFGSLYQEYDDLRLSHLKIEGSSGGLLQVTASWVGGVPQYRTSTALAASAVEKTARIRFADGAAALKFGGAALPLPNHFVFDIDRGISVIPGDTTAPSDTTVDAMSVSMQFDYAPASHDIFLNTVYGGSSPSDAAAVTTTPYEPAGSPAGISFLFTQATASRSLALNMTRVQVDPFADTPDTAPGPLMRSVTVKAYGAAAGTLASPVQAVVLNGQTAAY